AAAPEWQWAMPTWHPGGERIVASLSVDGEAFNLAEIEIGTGSMRWLTDLPAGALWPTVAADERTIVFTGYTVEGYDLFAIDYPRAGAPVAAPSVDSPSRTALAQQSVELDNVAVADYRPWPTLLPTSWTPVLELSDRQVRVGALTTGRDVLGYHNWSVGLSWQVSSEVENDTR